MGAEFVEEVRRAWTSAGWRSEADTRPEAAMPETLERWATRQEMVQNHLAGIRRSS